MSTATANLPPLPTRQEIARYCNQSQIRKKKITPRIVKGWDENGWLRPHPAYRRPKRYSADVVMDFLNGKTREI